MIAGHGIEPFQPRGTDPGTGSGERSPPGPALAHPAPGARVLIVSAALGADMLDEIEATWRTPAGVIPGSFSPIGFSPAGAFAYYEELPDEAIGGYLWRVVVVDLVRDVVLEERLWTDGGLRTITDVTAWRAAEGEPTRALLGRHGIARPAGPLLHLPIVYEGAPMALTASVAPGGAPNQDLFATLTLWKVDAGRKDLGTVPFARWTGEAFLYGTPPQPVGWFLSPFEPRAAILSIVGARGYEGPPNVLSPVITGAHLVTGFK